MDQAVIPNFGGEGWAGLTTLHPISIATLFVCGLALLSLPRRFAFWPLVAITCLIPSAQRIIVLSIDFDLIRCMLVVGIIRVWTRSEHRGFKTLTLDRIYSILRKTHVDKTSLLRIHRDPDILLALEFCMLGPFIHLGENLATREVPFVNPNTVAQTYHPNLATGRFRIISQYWAIVSITREYSRNCARSLFYSLLVAWYFVRRIRHLRRRIRRVLHRIWPQNSV